MTLLLETAPERAAIWRRVFDSAGEEILIGAETVRDPSEVTHLACWRPPADLGCYPALRAVLSLGAGVDHMPPMPPGIAVVRSLAPGIEEMVRDWVVMAVLMLHRDLPAYLGAATRDRWLPLPVRPARSRRIGIMGMGRIGALAAASLRELGFPVAGWSRSGRATVAGCRTYGETDLGPFLAEADILVGLLPLTDSTRRIFGAELFSRLPEGAGFVQAGRGAQIDMAALAAALDSGRIWSAMLDVTDPEPLPPGHPFWRDPRVIVTPHIAAHTDAEEGARHALAVLRAEREGRPLPGLVDPSRGY